MKWHRVSCPIKLNEVVPPERKVVLVWLAGNHHLPFCGYVRYSSKPYFVVYHGNSEIGAEVIAWCDCLPDKGPPEVFFSSLKGG